MSVAIAVGVEGGDEFFGRAVGDERGGAGGAQQAFGGEVVGVGVAGALAGDDADAAAGADSLAGGFDEGLVDADGGRGDGFEVEVGVVATGGEGFAEAALEEALGEAELFKKVTLLGLREPGGRCDGCGHSVPLEELDDRGDTSIVGVCAG